jgi:hypothetical protein
MTPERTLRAALQYARAGHPVLPIAPGEKIPLAALVPHGLRDATLDETAITSWWTKEPGANVAIRCDGLLVLDVDGEAGFESLAELQREHGPLPETLRQRSPRGGAHLLFRLPSEARIGNSTKGIGEPQGIDVRGGERGYLLVAPSTTAKGAYVWDARIPIALAPAWLVAALTHSPRPAVVPSARRLAGEHTPYGRTALDREVSEVAAAREGTRNAKLNEAAFALGQLEAGGELVPGDAEQELVHAAQAAGLPPAEAQRTVRSGLTAGRSAPRSAPTRDRDHRPVEHAQEDHREDAQDGAARPATRRSFADVAPRSVRWLVQGVIPRATTTVIGGQGGLGKSTYLLGVAAKVTRGELGSDPGSVIVVSYEDTAAEIIRPRLEAAQADLGRVFEILIPPELGGTLVLPRDLELLEAEIADTAAKLVIFDPVVAAIDPAIDCHKDQHVRSVLAPLAAIAERCDCAICAVLHVTKSPSSDPYVRLSSSAAFYNASRSPSSLSSPTQPTRRTTASSVR